MGFSFQEFPNADFYDSDLRELLKSMKELEDKYNLVLTKKLKEFIAEILHDLFVNCTYIQEHERLKLCFESAIISDGDYHIYKENSESISIEDLVNLKGE